MSQPVRFGLRVIHNPFRSYVHRTPIATSTAIDQLASDNDSAISVKLVAKCENLQKVGGESHANMADTSTRCRFKFSRILLLAFKIRGATNAILSILTALEHTSSNAELSNLHVITHSSGNHAQAMAYAARTLGVQCQVVMPSNSASVKKAAVRGYGATVTECIPTLQAREDTTNAIMDRMKSEGKTILLVPPYDDGRIIAGQGTLAIELLEQAREVDRPLDVLIAPVGGGGMLSGCAIAAKALKGADIWVVGAEPAGADDAFRSFQSREFVPSVDPKTIADGLRTSLGAITFPIILQYVDAIHTVSEEQIMCAIVKSRLLAQFDPLNLNNLFFPDEP